MTRRPSRSLRAQLIVLGLIAALTPLLIVLGAVFTVEDENVGNGPEGASETLSEGGVSGWVSLAAVIAAALAVAMVVWWANRALRPITSVTELADDIQTRSLDRRIENATGPTELTKLTSSFNRMLDRLETATEADRRFAEDASHELRTPIAALSARLEVMARRNDEQGADSEDLERCIADVDRLRETLDDLLDASRARRRLTAQVDNDLAVIVRRVVDRAAIAHPTSTIRLEAPERLLLPIDGPSVDRALTNLVDNAVVHGGGDVTVTVTATDQTVDLAVSDRGPGIASDRIDHIFDRSGHGGGIGLAVVRQVANAYGGVSVRHRDDGAGGLCVTMSFHHVSDW